MTARKAELILLLLAFVWGSTFVLMQGAIKWVPPFTFLTIRFILATVCLLFMLLFVRKSPIMKLRIWFLGLLLGGLLAVGFGLQILSLLSTTSGNSAFFTSAVVVIVPLFSLLLLSTPITSRMVLSLTLVMVGLFLLSGSQLTDMNRGDLLAFLCAFAFALHVVCLKKWGADLPIFSLVAVQTLFAGIFCGVAAFIWEPWQQAVASDVMLQPAVVVATLVCSLLATAGAYLILAYTQRYTSPNRTALVLTTEPIFAVGIDYMWNHVLITDWKLLGCCLVLIGVVWANFIQPTSPSN